MLLNIDYNGFGQFNNISMFSIDGNCFIGRQLNPSRNSRLWFHNNIDYLYIAGKGLLSGNRILEQKVSYCNNVITIMLGIVKYTTI